MRQGVIYSITCPVHSKVIYVGQTVDPKSRFRSYFGSVSSGTAIDIYIKTLIEKNLRPTFTIHLRCDEDCLNVQECAMIEKFISEGNLMLNCRNNLPDNYHSAREFYLGIEKPKEFQWFDVVDLTEQQTA